MTGLVSPTTGLALRAEGPDAVTDGTHRWPMIDGIAYLRTGREAVIAAVLDLLDRGCRESALALLLADQDDWWDGPRALPADLLRLIRERRTLTLRDAMTLLAFGRVGDYFAHRWSDPTFLAGLALLDAHWNAPSSAFELACGIGHYLRDLARRGVSVYGGDVVFAKLWLARHWVVPEAELVCFDAGSPWPTSGRRADLVLCHDAFYFLEPKVAILARLRDAVAPGGRLAIGHIHNRAAENLSAGVGLTQADLAGLFPDATLYDDDELTRAAAEARAPVPQQPTALAEAESFSLMEGGTGAPRAATGPLCRPVDGAALRRNPLYAVAPGGGLAIAWPSERYRAEYAPRATYRPRIWGELDVSEDAARRREMLDIPARW